MIRTALLCAAWFLLVLVESRSICAESLQGVLQAGKVPIQNFVGSELSQQITSYAVSDGDPYLLAYYGDDGSGLLKPPLYVIRYSRTSGSVGRTEIRDIDRLSNSSRRIDCLGSALRIREVYGRTYIETHLTPSAGCVVVLSPGLSFKTALPGLLLGFLGANCAILSRNEVHFMSVHPLHIDAFDLIQNRSVKVFPPEGDFFREQYSRLIQPRISEEWCRENSAQCDPSNFDTELNGELSPNEAARAFGFEARFDAAGFGEDAGIQVPPRNVAYIFRERAGKWQYREYEPSQLRRLFGVANITELVRRKPSAAFQSDVRK